MARNCLRAAAIASLACMAACAADENDSGSLSSLRVGLSVPVLQSGNTGLGFHKSALTRETLITIASDGRPAPRILESWESSPDRLVWRLRVRRGVRFHDGTTLTAHVLAPQMSARLKALSLGSVSAVEAEDDSVIRITLNEPYAFLFDDIVAVAAERAVGEQRFGTGPYAVVEESPERLLFKAVPDHYRDASEIDQVEVTLYPDQRNAWGALMRDEIDMLYDVSQESLDFVRSESSVTVSTFTRPFVYVFGFNHNHPELRDPRVRRALDLAVDRAALIRTGLAGQGEPAASHVWPRHWAHDSAMGVVPYDPSAAVRLLEEAGRHLRSEPGRMPARLRLHCVVHGPFRKLALVLQRQLAAVDVDLQLDVLPTDKMIGRLGTGDFESFVFELNSHRGFKFPYQFWHSQRPLFQHGYRAADDVLDRVRRAPTDEAFLAAVSSMQRRFRDDPPAVFLAWSRVSRAVSRRFEIEASGEDVYHTIARWKPAPKGAN